MKKQLALLLLTISLDSLAAYCEPQEIKEIAHEKLNIISENLFLSDANIKLANSVIAEHYWGANKCDNFHTEYSFLSLAFTDKSKDDQGLSIREKMINIAQTLSQPRFTSIELEPTLINDYLTREFGCLNNQSC